MNETPIKDPAFEEIPVFYQEGIKLSVMQSLQPEEVRERAFHLANGAIIYALCIGELPDSFLVGMAATLQTNERGDIKVHLISKSRVTRLFKTTVAMLGFCDKDLRKGYFEHLLSIASTVPDLLTPERCVLMRDILYTDVIKPTPVTTSPKYQEETVKPGKPAKVNLFEEVPAYMAGYSSSRH